MASTQQIKSRIKSVKNTKQITKAMELVAASRMRRAQEAVGRTRLFSKTARELLTRLSQLVEVSQHELFQTRPVKARLLIVITSDRGLAGAYNSNILRMYLNELKKDKQAGIKSYTICVGRKGAHLAARLSDTEVMGSYTDFPDNPDSNQIRPIITTALEMFLDGKIDAVDVLYTHYNSSISQDPTNLRILPAGFYETDLSEPVQLATFEPSAEVVLEVTAKRLVEVQLMQSVLESNASEHSMRMMAMKSASDNATELTDDLTLAFNNARQAAITQELAEISGGAEAMQD